MKILEWRDIEDEFNQSLVIGNGASISVDPVFSYSNLLEAARNDELLEPEMERLFEYVGSSDFELVLTMLWHAFHVNSAIEVKDERTSELYSSLRKALIETVRRHHASYENVSERLAGLADYLKNFETVVSLNYDLILYWAMMKENGDLGGAWFKDAFIDGKFLADWNHLRNPYGKAAGVTMVFYPHGNLALATTLTGDEHKISSPVTLFSSTNLLPEVLKRWESAKVVPLFVAEGTSSQKRLAINRSAYLRQVFEKVLPTLGENVAIYGWAASEQDQHVLEQLLKGSKRLAFSVRRSGRESSDRKKCEQIRARVMATDTASDSTEVLFYWADGEGTWGAA